MTGGGGGAGAGVSVGVSGDGGSVTVGVGVADADGVGDGVAMEVGVVADRLGAGAAGCGLAQPPSARVAPNAAAASAGREIFMMCPPKAPDTERLEHHREDDAKAPPVHPPRRLHLPHHGTASLEAPNS